MKFRLLFVSSVSACFELDSKTPYYAENPYDVYVNGEKVLTDVKTNVFSLFQLRPDTSYEVRIDEDAMTIQTKKETACLRVRDFGAAGDGLSDDTDAIQQAINVCPEGGRVLLEEGTYFIRPLQLKSHITFDLEKGAVLKADTVEEHFPILPGQIDDGLTGEKIQISSFEGLPMPCYKSIISAYHAEDIVITGEGIIDGCASYDNWWKNVKEREIGRPRLCFLNQCDDVTIHGITGRNSPAWNFHPFFSRKIHFYDMGVEAPAVSPNTDGTDPESCDDVHYIGVRFSVGDDAIAIKSGKMYMGMKYKTPASNHLIRNCLMEYAHGAVVLGSEISGGIKDLSVSQCYFRHTDRGLRIKTRRGRGKYCVVDGVEFSNIRMDNVKVPLTINMFYKCDPDGGSEYVQTKKPQPVDERTPYLGSFTFKDMECTDCEWAAGYFYGLPEMPVGSVTLQNVSFTYKEDAESGAPAMMVDPEEVKKAGLVFYNVKHVKLENVSLEGQDGDRIRQEGVDEIDGE